MRVFILTATLVLSACASTENAVEPYAELYCSAERLELAKEVEKASPDVPRPLVRIPPQYPAQCAASDERINISLVFDVSSEGRAVNVCVKEMNRSCALQHAEKALERFKFEQEKPYQNLETTFYFQVYR